MLQVLKMSEKIEMTGDLTKVYLDWELVECNLGCWSVILS